LNLINKEVIHSTLGVGHVVSLTEKIITVQFGEKLMKFSYPSIFNDKLKMSDSSLQHRINELCENENYAINRQKEERLQEFESRFADLPDTKSSKAKRAGQNRDKNNIAIKCNYCDGGRSETVFGYKGICSDEVLHQNVSILKRPWCSSPGCPCKRYSKGEISRAELEQMNKDGGFVCYESRLMRDWVASVGRFQSAKKNDKPIKMTNARVNRLCVLTTKGAGELEAERKIFAAFVISEVEVGDEKVEGNVHAHAKFRIDLTQAEAEQVRFWEFHKNKSKPETPFWGSGLLRYITDSQSINIIKAMMEAAVEPEKKAHILEVLEYYCRVSAAAASK
jgi:hypothetical protein